MRAGKTASLVLALALAFVVAGEAAAPSELVVVVENGSTRSVPVQRHRGYPAAEASTLAGALGYVWTGAALRLDSEWLHFAPGSPFFSAGNDVFQLANPVYLHGAEMWIPVGWALDWLPQHRSGRWRYLDGRLVERPRAASRPHERGAWLVLVDPGHGGKDPGAIGLGGTREKDLTLAIARRVAKRLGREPGIDVVLTRSRDTLIALADRPGMAQRQGHESGPDLFLSIHANSMPKKPNSARGAETYFLAVAKTEQARQVALRENSAMQFEDEAELQRLEPLQFILSDLQSAANLRESSLFAAAIDRSFAGSLPMPTLGVKQAGFLVLVGATMPAALVEVGYLSNRAEEKLLRSSSHQAKIADALADAVVSYLAEYGRRVWSSFSSGG